MGSLSFRKSEMEENIYGIIYGIVNVVNGKWYIGSTLYPSRRLKAHKRELKKGKHDNPKLQNAYTYYGKDSFIFVELDQAYDEVELATLEMIYTDEYDALNNGYVLMAGRDHIKEMSDEVKRKLSEVKRGQIPWNKGKTGIYSDEVLRRIGKASKARNVGKTLSEEHKQKISESKKGELNPCYGRTGALNPMYGKSGELSPTWGRKHSPESIQKMRKPKRRRKG